VNFRVEHRFEASPATVAAALLDPRFYEALELPDVGPAELVSPGAGSAASDDHADRDSVRDSVRDSEDDVAGTAGVIVVRYEYTGDLDPLARRFLGRSRFAWTQTLRLEATTLDERAYDGVLEIDTQSSPSPLRARAAVHLAPSGSGGARRVIEGDLVVALPGVGRMAERRLLPGVLRRLDVEAAAMDRWLH